MKEEVTEVFVNSKDTMAVLDMNQFKDMLVKAEKELNVNAAFTGIF